MSGQLVACGRGWRLLLFLAFPLTLDLLFPHHPNEKTGRRAFRRYKCSLHIAALTVRYLTRRYISEYRRAIDLLYRHTVCLDDVTSEVEILDVSLREVCLPRTDIIAFHNSICLYIYITTTGEKYYIAHKSMFVCGMLLGLKLDW